jgi:hypothetical protein
MNMEVKIDLPANHLDIHHTDYVSFMDSYILNS